MCKVIVLGGQDRDEVKSSCQRDQNLKNMVIQVSSFLCYPFPLAQKMSVLLYVHWGGVNCQIYVLGLGAWNMPAAIQWWVLLWQKRCSKPGAIGNKWLDIQAKTF